MSLAVPGPILKSEKLYSPLVNNSGLFTKIKIVSFNLWVFLFPTATKFLRHKYLSRLDSRLNKGNPGSLFWPRGTVKILGTLTMP